MCDDTAFAFKQQPQRHKTHFATQNVQGEENPHHSSRTSSQMKNQKQNTVGTHTWGAT